METETHNGLGLGAPPCSAIFAFEVSVKGTGWTQIVNARTAGKAKKEYHRQVIDAWPDVPFTAMRCRKIGPPHTSDQFRHNARYRGLPYVTCGYRVKVHGNAGTIVGHNESANFNVLFDDDAEKYAGLTLNVHPQDVILQNVKVVTPPPLNSDCVEIEKLMSGCSPTPCSFSSSSSKSGDLIL